MHAWDGQANRPVLFYGKQGHRTMLQDDALASYHFHLPPGLIAQHPAERRDASRLMVLHDDGKEEDRGFGDLPSLLAPGDILVRNNARVLPARLLGKRPGGGAVELLLVRPTGDDAAAWLCLARPASHLREGMALSFGEGALTGTVGTKGAGGEVAVRFSLDGQAFRDALQAHGLLPLPPYIKRLDGKPTSEDVERYQTSYAKKEGAVAAPTAGLHFTPMIDRQLAERGVEILELTLYVGPGTFRPIKTDNLSGHRMDAERYEIPAHTWETLAAARREGRRITAVGTTTVRTLESAALNGEAEGWTSLFIRPGHRFAMIDGLVTNFHLPGSSLLVMLAALIGRERILAAYERAVRKGYRFYSYGDAMLVWRAGQE